MIQLTKPRRRAWRSLSWGVQGGCSPIPNGKQRPSVGSLSDLPRWPGWAWQGCPAPLCTYVLSAVGLHVGRAQGFPGTELCASGGMLSATRSRVSSQQWFAKHRRLLLRQPGGRWCGTRRSQSMMPSGSWAPSTLALPSRVWARCTVPT